MLVMTACENFALNWIFSVYSLSQLISLRSKPANWQFRKNVPSKMFEGIVNPPM